MPTASTATKATRNTTSRPRRVSRTALRRGAGVQVIWSSVMVLIGTSGGREAGSRARSGAVLVAATDSAARAVWTGRSIRRSIEHVYDVRARVRTNQGSTRTFVRTD